MNPTSETAARPGPPEPSPPRPARRWLWGAAATALVLMLVAAGLVWALRDEPAASDARAGAPAPGAGDAAGLAAYDLDGDGIVYQSGMHPWVVQDEPGNCPICGMDLQPVSVSGAVGGTVQVDAATRQNIGVRTAPVEVVALERTLRTNGVFEANERARTAVSLKVEGWVERLYVDAEGDRVRAGQPLLELYSPQLVATQEEYLLALRNRDLLGTPEAERLVAAARRRLALYDISPEQVARLEAAGEVTRTLTLASPATGTVVAKAVVEGMQVGAGRTLMEIVDLSQLWLQADVPEQDLGWVERGTRATIRLESRPGQPLAGRVEYVYDMLDPATRTGRARIVVPNPGGRIKPGMYATATLFGAPDVARPVVPSEAVIRSGDEAVVILALGEGRFQPQPVVLGFEMGERVQILEGLGGGETVVTSAQFLIDSEARLAAAIQALTGEVPSAGSTPTVRSTTELGGD